MSYEQVQSRIVLVDWLILQAEKTKQRQLEVATHKIELEKERLQASKQKAKDHEDRICELKAQVQARHRANTYKSMKRVGHCCCCWWGWWYDDDNDDRRLWRICVLIIILQFLSTLSIGLGWYKNVTNLVSFLAIVILLVQIEESRQRHGSTLQQIRDRDVLLSSPRPATSQSWCNEEQRAQVGCAVHDFFYKVYIYKVESIENSLKKSYGSAGNFVPSLKVYIIVKN